MTFSWKVYLRIFDGDTGAFNEFQTYLRRTVWPVPRGVLRSVSCFTAVFCERQEILVGNLLTRTRGLRCAFIGLADPC